MHIFHSHPISLATQKKIQIFSQASPTKHLGSRCRLPGYPMPKRLRAEEAFWQLEPDLQKAEPCGDENGMPKR